MIAEHMSSFCEWHICIFFLKNKVLQHGDLKLEDVKLN
jgi:hypothetical protein